MKVVVVNDAITQIPGTRTFWSDLVEWFGAEFVCAPFQDLPALASSIECDVMIRNGSYWPAITSNAKQVSLIQDIFDDSPLRAMQREAIASSVPIYNSSFTAEKCGDAGGKVIPLPVDFRSFEPQNAMGCQQALGLPDGCICWVGATQGPAGHVKGYDIFLKIVRMNPDLHFVGVFKDAIPDSFPPNLRCFLRLTHEELVKVIGACRVGLCTSRMESQHLAGIEMGACGLKLIVPDTGVYWKREDLPIWRVTDPTPQNYAASIRGVLPESSFNEHVRGLWQKEFDRPVIRAQWEKLIAEVENDPPK
jgi:hypothetical protein